MVIGIAINCYYYRLYYNYFLLRIEEVRVREEMKRDRKKRVKSRRSSLRYEGFNEIFAGREQREKEEMLYASIAVSKSEARMKEDISKMQKELESQKSALTMLRKSKRNEISKEEVEAKDEDDEFKVAVLDVGMATVKVL